MRLVCRPVGRGNWAPVIVEFSRLDMRQPDLFRFRVGDRFTLGTTTYRIARIEP